MASPFSDEARYITFRPTRACTGFSDGSVIAGLNMMPKGAAEAPYFENVKSHRDTAYTAAGVALTGTVAVTANSDQITGTGTSFLTELQVGDFLILSRRLVLVERIVSNTVLICSVVWSSSAAGLAAVRPRLVQSINGRVMTYLRGNVVPTAQGHLLGVGAGVVERDGAPLPGAGLTLDSRLRVGFLSGGSFTQLVSGLTIPAATDFVVTETGGGTKDMPVGKYSIRFVPGRSNPISFANPTDAIQFQITTAGNRVHVVFNAPMDVAKGQDEWRAYVSLPNEAGGPWFFFRTITAAQLGGTGAGTSIDIEWRAGEVQFNETVGFRNFPPKPASFVTLQSGVVILYGVGGENDLTPGPSIHPAIDDNIEAFDPDARVTLPETIVGVTQGVGRDYVACPDRIYIATLSGNTGRAIIWRPFWNAGVYHPRQIVFVNDQLYGCTKAGPRRSADDGGEGSERYYFAEDVAGIFARWNLKHVIVAHDPINEAVCYIHPSTELNAAGKVVSEMLAFNLRTERWSTLIHLSDTSADVIVSSATDTSGEMTFVANGNLYEHDKGLAPVSWYLADAFRTRPGYVQATTDVQVTGLMNQGSAGVFGYRSSEAVPDLSQPNSASLVGAIALPDASECTEYQSEQALTSELVGYTVRLEGVYPGNDAPLNRVEHVMVMGNQSRRMF